MVGTWTARVLAGIALVGVVFTLALHLATFSARDLTGYLTNGAEPLIAVTVGLVLIIAVLLDGMGRFRDTRTRSADIWKMLNSVPLPFGLLAIVAIGYLPINFIACLIATHGHTAIEQGNQYFTVNHGAIIRAITRAEYVQYQSYSLRLLTGILVLLYLLPAIYFIAGALRGASVAEERET